MIGEIYEGVMLQRQVRLVDTTICVRVAVSAMGAKALRSTIICHMLQVAGKG
jgi:hypothetical protein